MPDITSLLTLLIMLPPLLFALTFHEFAHAWTALKFGDPTARLQGRLTLNPLMHLDPVGTVMLVITAFVGFGLGWAKPVPVDTRYLKRPRQDMLWIALAGPVSNLILAFVCGWILSVVPPSDDMVGTFREMALAGIRVNLSLAFFNLLPIPPLDGSRVVAGLLPAQQAYQYSQLEMYGPMLLIGLIMADSFLRLNLIQTWISVPALFFFEIIFKLFS